MKRVSIIVLVGLVLILEFTSLIVLVKGQEQTTEIIAEADTYVDSSHPTDNYGLRQILSAGNWEIFYVIESEAYFRFKAPSYISYPPVRVEVLLSVLTTISLKEQKFIIAMVEEEWQEMTMTWQNKPQHGQNFTIIIKEEGIQKIDITDYVRENDEISICIKGFNMYEDSSIQLFSIEGYENDEDAPRLIWHYNEMDWGFIIIGIFSILGIIGIGTLVVKYYPKWQEKRPLSQTTPRANELMELENINIGATDNCRFCGARIDSSSRTCDYCGHDLMD